MTVPCKKCISIVFIDRFFPLQLRREKIDLENTLEQEQEALVNRLWKRMDKLEAEKRFVLLQCVCCCGRGNHLIHNVLD